MPIHSTTAPEILEVRVKLKAGGQHETAHRTKPARSFVRSTLAELSAIPQQTCAALSVPSW
jgi:hypothetical protein